VPGGTTRNLASAGAWTAFPDTLGDARRIVLADAQTSGGLLIAVGAEGLAILEGALASRNVPAHVIGWVHAGPPGHITVSESP
jgi:selenide,water dikinase